MGTFVRYLLVLVEALCSLLLIGVILVQRTKSQGLGVAMGGQMGEALFGTRMGNVLTRATVILGIVFLVNTTLLAYLGSTGRRASVTDEAVTAPVAAAPAAPMNDTLPVAPPIDMPVDALPVGDAPIEIPAPVEVDEAGETAAAPAPTPAAAPAEMPAPTPVE